MDDTLTIKISKYIVCTSKDLHDGYHVNCVPDGKWVYCDKFIKGMWSGELSDKNNGSSYLCLFQHQNKELHVNVILNQTMGRKQGFTKL